MAKAQQAASKQGGKIEAFVAQIREYAAQSIKPPGESASISNRAASTRTTQSDQPAKQKK